MSPTKMPEKPKAFIEAECLKAARHGLGARHLERVFIERIRPEGTGPNWRVLEFRPQLPPLAYSEAEKAIAPLRQRYALAEPAS